MARTHVFLAPGRAAFGEVQLGVALARALHEHGDRVLFLAPSNSAPLLSGQPFRWGSIDYVWGRIGAALLDVIAQEHVDDVVLVDACTTYLALASTDASPAVLDHLPVPLYALDLWNIIESGLKWDTCAGPWPIPDNAAKLVRRLIPVPFVRPRGATGLYCALPAPPVDPARARREARAELGIADGTRLLLTTTARFQTLEVAITEYNRHLVVAVADHFVDLLGRLGPDLVIAHVGPLPFPRAHQLPGYRFLGQVAPARFDALLAAADLLVTINHAATTIVRALRYELPIVVLHNRAAAAAVRGLAAGPQRLHGERAQGQPLRRGPRRHRAARRAALRRHLPWAARSARRPRRGRRASRRLRRRGRAAAVGARGVQLL